MVDTTQAPPAPETETPTNDLAEAWNERKAAEAAEAQESALDVLLAMPRGEGGHPSQMGQQATGDMDWLLDAWPRLIEVGRGIMQTGMARKGLNNPEEVALVLALGRELRIKPIVALNGVYVVNRKPTCESKLIAALIFREHGSGAIHYETLTDTEAEIHFKRRDQDEYTPFKFTIEDAKQAGLLTYYDSKAKKTRQTETWKKYPKFMLRHRCMSMGGNAIFPDVTMGMITPEEMGLPVKLDVDGNVVVDQAKLGTPRPRKARKAPTPLIDPDAEAVLRKDQTYAVTVTEILDKSLWWLADYPGSTYADWAAEYKRCEEADDQAGMDKVTSATHTAKGHKRPWRKWLKAQLDGKPIKVYTESNPETHKIVAGVLAEITIDAVGIDVSRPGRARNDDGSRVVLEDHDAIIASGIRLAKAPAAPPPAADEQAAEPDAPEPPDEDGDVRGKMLIRVQEWRQNLGPAVFAKGIKDVGIHDYGQSTVGQLAKLLTWLSGYEEEQGAPEPEEPPAGGDTPADGEPDATGDIDVPCEACGADEGEKCEPGCPGF